MGFHGVECYNFPVVFEPLISAGNLRSKVTLYVDKFR
jgi:hypothetical protein